MPVKNRHSFKNLGAIAAGAQSTGMDISEAIHALLHIEGTAGAVVTLQGSPDKGTTWHNVFNDAAPPTIWTVTLGAAPEVHLIKLLPGFVRVAVATQPLAECSIEGLRDV